MLMKSKFTRSLLFFAAFIAGITYSRAQYCASGATSNFDSDITDVQFLTIKNNTGSGGCAGYTHFTNQTATVDIGSTYPITVQLGVHTGATCGSDIYTKSAVVFIDFNRDGDFQDAGERVGNTNYAGGTHSTTFNVTVPCTAVPGVTRMRVVCVENSPANIQPCGTFTYGETEDYDITMLAGPNPTSNFSIPDTVYSGWIGTYVNSNQTGYTHKWYNSAIDPTLQSVAATTVNYKYAFATAGTYTLKLESSNCQGTAISTKQVVVVNPTSIPLPNFVTSVNRFTFTGNPVNIEFYDLSSYGPTSWEWTITPSTSGGAPWFWSNGNEYSQNPSAFFFDYGIYEVCLTVTNAVGTSAPLCRSSYIIIEPPSGRAFENWMERDLNCLLDSAYIYDKGGPNGNYSNNEYNTFVIEPCGATSVTLQFLEFAVNAGDVLRIYDGPNSSAPLLASYSGTTIPLNVTAKSGKMTLEFQSDGNSVNAGFKARYTSVVPSNGSPLADFVLPDTIWECSGGVEHIFTNLSTGVVPGQASYDWIFDYDPSITYLPGYCEACDEESPTWQYFPTGSPEDYYIRVVLKSCEGNDTLVKKFILSPTSNLATVDFMASNRRVSVGSIVKLTEESVGGCSYEWEITPASGWSYQNGTGSTDRIVDVKFTNPGSYNVELIVTNDNGTNSRIKTNYVDVIDYCVPTVTLPSISDVGISRVKIENIDRTSNPTSPAGYTNYASTDIVEMIAGKTYSITIERPSTFNRANRKVWVDFNRDGIFQEPAERVVLEPSANTQSLTATFTVPDYTVIIPGESRMRVASAMDNNSNLPCGPMSVGEYEDYGVTLKLDDQPPVITMNGSDTLVIEVNTQLNDPGATAFDNIEGNISNRIVVSNSVDTAQPGIYFVDYNVTDGSGLNAVARRRTVIVSADLTAPVLTLTNGTTYLQSVLVPFTDPGYAALDNPGNTNLTQNVVVSGAVDVNVIGNYDLKYKVTDAYGNSSEVVRTVQVRDTTKPVINVPANLFWQVGVPFVNAVQVTDNYDQDATLTQIGTVFHNNFGTYTVVFRAADASGNQTGPVTVMVTVGDTVRPVISTIPGTETITVRVNTANFSEPKVTATDNYFPSVQLNRDASGVDVYTVGTYDIIYTATDGAGNVATWTRKVNVIDDLSPMILTMPVNICRWDNTFDPMDDVSVSDNYNTPQWFVDNNAIDIVLNNLNVNYPGVYAIVYRATDASGNRSADMIRYVQVAECQTGVEENLESLVNIYPNPNNGQFSVELMSGVYGEVTVKVINTLGATVSQQSVNGTQVLEVNLKGAASGVYLVEITNNGNKITKRVVVN